MKKSRFSELGGFVDSLYFQNGSTYTVVVIIPFVTCFVTIVLHKQNRVWAAPDRLEQAWYALNTTKVIFEYFEDLYDMDYQPDKLGEFSKLNSVCLT